MDWQRYTASIPLDFSPTDAVLDVGCGQGNQLLNLNCNKFGVDVSPESLAVCAAKGLLVAYGQAEALPFPDNSFDAVICKVVLPYTIEDKAMSEIARVVKPGGICQIVGHGSGYYLRYLLLSPSFKKKFYGLRSLLNTWYWQLSRRRLPGFLGDSIYQSPSRLHCYFQRFQLLGRGHDSPRFVGRPVFLYYELTKL